MLDLILVFVKHPVMGKAKTRLAVGIGHEKAIEVYEKLLLHTRNVVEAIPATKAIFYGNLIPPKDLWSEAGYPRYLQLGEDLGERMAMAFDWGFGEGYDRIILIGSDIALLHAGILTEAFEMLSKVDLVIGPAMDGGYYLVGMKAPFPKVFQHKTWSTPTVLDESIADIHEAGKSLHLLPQLSDVDTVEDLPGTFLASYYPTKGKE